MDKKLINEDITNMKYLFGYKPGRVISEQDFDYTTDAYLVAEMDEERRPERLVKHIDTNKLVGTHKYGRGFTPNRHGEELGFEHHPSSIPNKTKFGGTEVGDFDYEDDDFDFKIPPYDDEEINESNPFKFSGGLDEYNFPEELNDRLSDIYDLLDEEMEDPDNDPSDYSDMYDFASVVISGVLIKLREEFGDEFEEYEDDVDDYLRNNEDEYIFDFYNSHSNFDDEDDYELDEFDDKERDMDTGEELYPSFSSDRKFMGMSKSMGDMETEDEDTLFEQEEPENDRYMFFSNLEQIHRQMGILLEKDPEMIHSILENGHDWAQDHIATAKESIDQVFDFIMNEEKGNGEEMFEGYAYDDVDEVNPDDFNDDNENDLNQLKQKHGIKFRKDFEGDDDEFVDYLYDNKGSYDNFIKDYKGNKEFTFDNDSYEPTDDNIHQLKQKHGIKFRDEFDGDDDEFLDYLYDNKNSFDNFKKDYIKLK